MLKMGTMIYDSDRLFNSGMSGAQLNDFVENADGFGRFALGALRSPSHLRCSGSVPRAQTQDRRDAPISVRAVA
jgi:hypothetical protein